MAIIICIGSQKGGVGKSTLTLALAGCLMQYGSRVLILDADKQHTVLRWYNSSIETQKRFSVMDVTGDFARILDKSKKDYDYILIDCPGKDSFELGIALPKADILLSPVRASSVDLITNGYIVDLYVKAKSFNPNIKGYFVLNAVSTSIFSNESKHTVKKLQQYKELMICKSFVCDRKVHRDAFELGCTVFDLDNIKAKKEIKNILMEILNDK